MLNTWDRLVNTWHELDIPEGYRPELTANGIYMEPPPDGATNLILDVVNRAFCESRMRGYGIFQKLAVGIECAEAIYIPDMCVAPRAAVPVGVDPLPADRVELAVEVTSRHNAPNDRETKRWVYGVGDIPRYLLIDPFDENGPSVTLFVDPADGHYTSAVTKPFGEPLRLGDPFDIVLDTNRF